MKKKSALLSLSLITLVSCSGGGNNLNSVLSTDSLNGTAAIGAPMSQAAIVVRGKGASAACVAYGSADENGKYSVALNGCSGPFLISAQSNVGTVYSIATDEDVGGVVNITPLTQVIASRVLGTTDIDSVAQNVSTGLSVVDKTKVEAETTKIKVAIAEIAKEFGAENVDIRKGVFSADGSGIDRVLDSLNIRPSGANLDMEVKGSGGVKITIPASDAAINNANFNSAVATKAKDATVAFAAIKTVLNNPSGDDINDCFDDMDKSCFAQYVHPDFMSDGYTTANGLWHELVDDDESVYIRVGNPVLIDMNATFDEAWIASDYYEKDNSGNYKKAWLDITRLKKDAGKWKIYGNQNPYPFVIQPAAIKNENGTVEKALNVRIFKTGVIPNLYSTKITSADLGLAATTLVRTTGEYERFKPSSNSASCASNNIMCDPFVKISQSESPLFVKLEVDYDNNGTIGANEIQYVISAPSKSSEFGAFTNTGSLCANYDPASTTPETLSWTLPSGHMTESLDFFTQSSGYIFDWQEMGVYDLEYESTSVPLRSSLVSDGVAPSDLSGVFDLTYASLMLRTVDADGRNYFRPKTCGTYQ